MIRQLGIHITFGCINLRLRQEDATSQVCIAQIRIPQVCANPIRISCICISEVGRDH